MTNRHETSLNNSFTSEDSCHPDTKPKKRNGHAEAASEPEDEEAPAESDNDEDIDCRRCLISCLFDSRFWAYLLVTIAGVVLIILYHIFYTKYQCPTRNPYGISN
ncbi:uncharacterized protein LOC106658889 [Trichogramma pretiosum]|uniref:uncharacterized protein LOC106658889 n=1 Tax=Trichogramma pretiosum TaxID=7493 RepID=UPI0006C98B2D|nr:uncharacterized protein LOC106658889 [Trichogramma pretiosum]